MKLEDLLQNRAALDEARALLDKADGEDRELSRAENGRYDEIDAELDKLEARIKREESTRDRERGLADASARRTDEQPGGRLELARREGPSFAEIRNMATLPAEVRMVDWVRARQGEARDTDEIPGPADYSIVRMLRAQADATKRSDLNEHELRALGEGTDAGGGVMVPEILSADILDRLRAASVVIAAGATIVPMESDTTVLARLSGGSTANWRSEHGPVTESDQTYERVELKAKVSAVLQKISFELLEDLSPQGEATVRNEIAAAIGLKIDLAALEGSGVDPEPLGLASLVAGPAGISEVSMGTNGSAPVNFDPVVQAWFAAKKKNAPDPTAFVSHPRDLETFALLKDTTEQPMRRPPVIEELPFASSSQIDTTRDQGTSLGVASNAYLGAWSELLIGARPNIGVRFQLLQERFADTMDAAFLSWVRADVAFAHEASFSRIIGLLE